MVGKLLKVADGGEGSGGVEVVANLRDGVRQVVEALSGCTDMDVASRICAGVEILLQAAGDLALENQQLQAGREELAEEIEETRARLSKALADFEVLKKVATFDDLTGLLNKAAFRAYMPDRFNACRTEGRKFTLLMLDGDNFKKINDGPGGHLAGDYVLSELGKIARECFRFGDFGFRGGAAGERYGDVDNGIGVRFGGDEFCFVLADTDRESAALAAKRFMKQVAAHDFVYDGHKVEVGVSIGVAEADYQTDESWMDVAKRADEALYQAKISGKARVEVA